MSDACNLCSGPTDPLETYTFCPDCMTRTNIDRCRIFAELQDALAHERDRARRVVRVFWRVRVPHRADWVYQGYRKHAWQLAKKMGGKVYRVTVRWKAKT